MRKPLMTVGCTEINKENKMKESKLDNGYQITMWLFKMDLGWLESERDRLTKKGWNVVIKYDSKGKVSLWRITGSDEEE